MTQDRHPDPLPTAGSGSAAKPLTPSEPAPLSSGESVYYEGGPARGDLVLSLSLIHISEPTRPY